MAKELRRSRKNRIFLGVLGGIGEHLDVDPTLVRLIFLVFLVFNPLAMTLLYFIVALVIPDEGEKPPSERVDGLLNETEERLGEIFQDNENSKANALILILLGAVLLATPLLPFLIPVVNFRTLLAVVFLIVGILLLARGD